MSRVRVTTESRCLIEGCPWTPEGDPDLAARRHVGESGIKGDGAKHATVTESVAL